MDIKTSVFKRAARLKVTKKIGPDGERVKVRVRGGWVFRIRYKDQDGKPCTIERGFFDLKSQAKDAMKATLRDLEKTGGSVIDGERMTFNHLIEKCRSAFYKEAHIVDGNKKSGVKSLKPVLSAISNLKAYFGPRLISAITPQSLFKYRDSRMRLQAPLKAGGKPRQLKIATVHRELGVMRRMMRHALNEDWVTRDIFAKAPGLFDTTQAKPRTRILSIQEEGRLIAACTGDLNREYKRKRFGKTEEITAHIKLDHAHLRAAIILALDTGMRRGEIIKMKWNDIDFDAGIINVLSSNTKTERGRIVPLSDRAARELEGLRSLSSGLSPFPIMDMKHAFSTVKEVAGITDLHFHDLRATAGDRMSRVYPLATVAKILGHQRHETTLKYYVGNELETVSEVKKWLDSRPLPQAEVEPVMSDMIN